MSWKTITTHPNYEISDAGEVRNSKTGRTLTPALTHGYHRITLCINNITSNWTIHRLVALYHIENPENYPCVDHIDRNRTNNHVSNLRWVTHSENSKNTGYSHYNRTGTMHHIVITRNGRFRVQITNGLRVAKNFKTSEEAVAFRDQWMADHPR